MSLSRNLIFTIVLLLRVITLTAQISHGGMPCPTHLLTSNGLRSSHALPYEVMPAFDVDSLIREDSLQGFGVERFAHKFKVGFDMENSGATTYLEDGTKVWRIGITSPKAFSLNLLFTEYEIPPQAKVFLYSPDRSTILGSFTSDNRQKSGILPIAPIEGDSVIVEYIEPAGADFKGHLRIGEVNHDYLGLRALPAKNRSLSCEVDVNCDERGNLPQKRSVCLIIVNGIYYCTGSLVNNTAQDDTPYVLTASHCLFSDYIPPVHEEWAETCVFFFNYETPYCYSDIQGSMEQSVAGASLAACNADYDMLLLKMSETVPIDYRPYYAGWNVSEEKKAPFYLIHHPEGDRKKVSIENDDISSISFRTDLFEEEAHWCVYWDSGITEGGSSGSPLFDADNRIVGALSGGRSYCEKNGPDSFYKLSKAWSSSSTDGKNLPPCLDPTGSRVLALEGKEPNDTPCIRLSNMRSNDELLPATESSQGYASGHNSYGYLRYAEKFEVEGVSKIYGIYCVPFSGSFSEQSPVLVSIYSGKDEPTHLLHEQILKISNTEYNQYSNKFKEILTPSWTRKENYLRLDTAVSASGNFFVVFDLPENPKQDFALFYSGSRWDDRNTAYFYHNGEWRSFRENPMAKMGVSLMVDVVCQRFSSQSQPDNYQKPETTAFVNEEGNLYILFEPSLGKTKQVLLYDISGRLLADEYSQINWYEKRVPLGVTIVHVLYDDHSEILKVVRQK